MRVLLHETMTGDFVTELEYSEVSWSTGVCRADDVKVMTPAYISRDWYQYAIPRKFTISVIDDDGRTRAAGVLGIPRGTANDEGLPSVEWPGTGVESIFERRKILPYPYWPLVDTAGYPITARDTRITGVDYGTMMKRLYLQAMSHPGGELPVAWQANRAGTREKGWAAVDGKGVQEAIADISELEGGVEWDWVPNVDDNDRLSWSFLTATDAAQELTSAFEHTWQSGGTEPDVRELEWKVSPEFMCSTAIFTGGKDDDRVMIARAASDTLIAAGIPLSEVWDSSHSSVSVQSTLDGWAQKTHDEGQAPVQYWSFDVRAERAASLRHGDWCTVDVEDHETIPDGVYPRRIIEVSGTHDSEWLSVTVAGELSW